MTGENDTETDTVSTVTNRLHSLRIPATHPRVTNGPMGLTLFYIDVCVCIHVQYIYKPIYYIYTHTYTHTDIDRKINT